MVTIKYKEPLNKDFFEHKAWQSGSFVCGVDEVGRGAMAGPLVCAALVLKSAENNNIIKDSKLMSKKELLIAYEWLAAHAWYTYSVIDPWYIDRHNIYQATLYGMKRAILQLMPLVPQIPTTIVVDSMPVSLENTTYHSTDLWYFNYAESKSISVAGASIIAKVTRDTLMGHLDPLFSPYALAQHKGYCTAAHRAAVQVHGPSIIHRTTYVSGKTWAKRIEQAEAQMTLIPTATGNTIDER